MAESHSHEHRSYIDRWRTWCFLGIWNGSKANFWFAGCKLYLNRNRCSEWLCICRIHFLYNGYVWYCYHRRTGWKWNSCHEGLSDRTGRFQEGRQWCIPGWCNLAAAQQDHRPVESGRCSDWWQAADRRSEGNRRWQTGHSVRFDRCRNEDYRLAGDWVWIVRSFCSDRLFEIIRCTECWFNKGDIWWRESNSCFAKSYQQQVGWIDHSEGWSGWQRFDRCNAAIKGRRCKCWLVKCKAEWRCSSRSDFRRRCNRFGLDFYRRIHDL